MVSSDWMVMAVRDVVEGADVVEVGGVSGISKDENNAVENAAGTAAGTAAGVEVGDDDAKKMD